MDSASVPALKVTDVTTLKRKKKSQQLKFSGFHITISTNKKPKDDEESQNIGRRLNQAIALTFTHDTLSKIIFYLKPSYNQDGEVDKGIPEARIKGNIIDYKAHIKKLKVQYAIELGGGAKGGRVHAHIILRVTHNSKIRIDIPELKQRMLQALNLNDESPAITSIYINIGIIRSDKNLEEYLKKKQVNVKHQAKVQENSSDTSLKDLEKDMKSLTVK